MTSDPISPANNRPKAAIITFGCKVNQVESSAISESLADSGYQIARPDEADLLIVNTCAVTEKAAIEARRLIRRLRRRKPSLKIAATGCLAQLEPATLAGSDMADLVLSQADKPDLSSHLALAFPGWTAEAFRGSKPSPPAEKDRPSEGIPAFEPSPASNLNPASEMASSSESAPASDSVFASAQIPAPDFFPSTPSRVNQTTPRTRAFHKIQDGCSAGCAYCAVPLARGPSKSSPLEEVLSGLRAYLEKGFREVVLTGIHLGHWGFDLFPRQNLSLLLEAIGKELEEPLRVARLRLSSLEPLEILLVASALKEKRWLVPHLHAPVQSGSNRVLAAMGRPYKAASAARLFNDLKSLIPDLNLGTDVMCGFPGETEEDFEATVNLIESVPFGRLHVFPFSARNGTKAANLPDQVPEPVKRARMTALRELAAKKSADFLLTQIGKTREALVETPNLASRRPTALTDNYIRVLLPPGSPVQTGDMVQVAIVGSSDDPAFAEAVLAPESPPVGAIAVATRSTGDAAGSEKALSGEASVKRVANGGSGPSATKTSSDENEAAAAKMPPDENEGQKRSAEDPFCDKSSLKQALARQSTGKIPS